jgi:hypothetical protein
LGIGRSGEHLQDWCIFLRASATTVLLVPVEEGINKTTVF